MILMPTHSITDPAETQQRSDATDAIDARAGEEAAAPPGFS